MKKNTKIVVLALILVLLATAVIARADAQIQDEEHVTVTSEADELRQDTDDQRHRRHGGQEREGSRQSVARDGQSQQSRGQVSQFDRFFDDLWSDWPSPASILRDFDLDRDFGFFWPSRHRNFIMDREHDDLDSSWRRVVRRPWFDGFRRAKDSILDRFSGGHCRRRQSAVPSFRARADLKQVGDAYELTIDVPGMDKKDIRIKVREKVDPWSRGVVDVLEVSGEHKEETTRRVEAEGQEGKIAAPEEKEKIAGLPDASEVTPAAPKKEDQKYIWTERTVGQFQRSVALPQRILKDMIHAKLDSGVLTVMIPIDRRKHEEETPVSIEIE